MGTLLLRFTYGHDPDPGEEALAPSGASAIGYFERDDQSQPSMYYFDEEAMYISLARLYAQTHGNTAFPFTQATFVQRLADAGISRTEVFKVNGKEKTRSKCRKRVEGEQRSFVCVPASAFADPAPEGNGDFSAAPRSVPAFQRLGGS